MGEDLFMRNAAQRPSIDAEGLLREYATTGNTAIRDRVVEAYLYICLLYTSHAGEHALEAHPLAAIHHAHASRMASTTRA